MMRTIRVTGKGRVKVRPDLTRLTITLEGTDKDYGETLRRSAEDTEALRTLLRTLGFSGDELKTLDFQVDTEYESYQEENVYKQRFLGYRWRHMMKLEFDSDNDRLGKVLYALAVSDVKPEFHISYTVKDPEAARNELLDSAVKDAQKKSAVLAAAAGVRLNRIQSVDYTWGEISLESRPMNRMLMADGCAAPLAAKQCFDMSIEPDDIEVSDNVTVVWEIE